MIDSLSDHSKQSARQRIDRFVQRFDDSYRRLAYYAALPLVLTPDLLNYLRNQFLRGEVPWVAEVDLLLSELCSPTGYEQYVMEMAVRAVLLEEMEQVLGRTRMEAVAQLLIDYVRKLARTMPQVSQRSLQTQQWAAMVYLDDQRQMAVEQIARSLQDVLPERVTAGQAGLSTANQAELVQLARITQELAPQLECHTTLLEYARVVSQLLGDRTSVSPEMLGRSYVVEGVELRVPVVGQGQAEIVQMRGEERLPVVEHVAEQTTLEIAQPRVEERSKHLAPRKILILTSNPRRDLNIDREIRDLQHMIQRSGQEALIEVKFESARLAELRQSLLRYQPQIVHFFGHGRGEQGLMFENDEGREQLVSTEALSNLFRLVPNHVECVLLSASYSELQANALVQHVNYVIGMRQNIRYKAAIAFSKGFYQALGYECSIEQSYEVGCNAIQLEISGGSEAREHLNPILKKRRSLGGSSSEKLSAETRVAIQVEVDKALSEEATSLREYREQVREYLADHKLEQYERLLLDQLRDELGLSIAETDRILAEEQAPILQARRAYEQRLTALIKRGFYPFNTAIKTALKKVQTRRNLTDEEVEQISKPIFEAAASNKLNSVSQGKGIFSTTERNITSNIEANIPHFQPSTNLLVLKVRQTGTSEQRISEAKKALDSITTILLLDNFSQINPLRLDEEHREIQEVLSRSQGRSRFSLVSSFVTQPRDVQRIILDISPQILHFSGQSESEQGLAFEDNTGQPKLLTTQALTSLFSLLTDHIECVILSRCYSEVQANAISEHINYVVGLDRGVSDQAALKFSASFYDALAAGRTYEEAFSFGQVAIDLSQ